MATTTKWQADECADARGFISIREYDGSPNGDAGTLIATVYNADDALKVAAAPDLLAACEAIIRDADHDASTGGSGRRVTHEAIDALRAAIAKARPACRTCGGTKVEVFPNSPTKYPCSECFPSRSGPACDGNIA